MWFKQGKIYGRLSCIKNRKIVQSPLSLNFIISAEGHSLFEMYLASTCLQAHNLAVSSMCQSCVSFLLIGQCLIDSQSRVQSQLEGWVLKSC